MKKKTKILLPLFVFMLPSWLFAQTVINGRVTEAQTNNPLQSVTVNEKGTNHSAQTDADGRFSISVSSPQAKLVVTYVGYVSQTVDASNNMAVSLAIDNTKMSEVIVT